MIDSDLLYDILKVLYDRLDFQHHVVGNEETGDPWIPKMRVLDGEKILRVLFEEDTIPLGDRSCQDSLRREISGIGRALRDGDEIEVVPSILSVDYVAQYALMVLWVLDEMADHDRE